MSLTNIAEIVPNPCKNFASDNASGIHPLVMEAMISANVGHAIGYDNDAYSREAQKQFKQTFGEQAETYLLFNGTGANVLALQGMVRSHETVYCSEEAHLVVDECGAPENHIGCKFVPIKSSMGKINTEEIAEKIEADRGLVHRSQPRVISLTQASERGTIYSLNELKDIVNFAHSCGLHVHMDGVHIHNAAVALNVTFKEMTTDIGIDVVSFGGTKNGLMMAEALVVLNPKLQDGYRYIRKQGMQLASKHRFLAAQYIAYFNDDLWRKNAQAANDAASYLAMELQTFEEISLLVNIDINMIFVTMPKDWILPLQKVNFFNIWNGIKNEVRLITSFDTTREDIDQFISAVSNLAMSKRSEKP